MVCAALETIHAACPLTTPSREALEELLGAVTLTRPIAIEAARILTATPLSASASLAPALLKTILNSSTLSVALAAAHLNSSEGPHVPTIAALVVRAVTLNNDAELHPMAQVCRALPRLGSLTRTALFYHLVDAERPLLPTEGSPRAEAHQRHVRFWLTVGSLVTIDAAYAFDAVRAVESALRDSAALPQTRVVLQNVWARAVHASMQAGMESDPSAATEMR